MISQQTRSTMFATTVFLAMAGALLACQSAAACTLCVSFPGLTAADYLLQCPKVVLARENPNQPFSYLTTEVLKGEPGTDEIDLFLDSQTRRILQTHPERSVVLAWDDATASWRNLGVAGPSYEAVIRRVLLVAPHWQDSADAQQRCEFFAPLLESPDRHVSQLAYLELSRAPYRLIRQLGQTSPRDKVLQVLNDRQYIEWWPLAILLLAQSDHPLDQQRIVRATESAAQHGLTLNLAAWTAALLEIKGAEGLQFLELHYLDQPQRSPEEREAVVKALLLHGGEGRRDLQNEIGPLLARMLAAHPELTTLTVTSVVGWEPNAASRQLLSTIDQSKLSPETLLGLRRHILDRESGNRQGPEPK